MSEVMEHKKQATSLKSATAKSEPSKETVIKVAEVTASTKKLAERVSKISLKTIYGRIPKRLDGPLNLMKIVGVISRVDNTSSAFGDHVCFRGEFYAKNMKDGSEYRSSVCILPEELTNEIIDFFDKTTIQSMQIGYMLGVQPSEEKRAGHSYFASAIVKCEEADPLASLLKLVEEKHG